MIGSKLIDNLNCIRQNLKIKINKRIYTGEVKNIKYDHKQKGLAKIKDWRVLIRERSKLTHQGITGDSFICSIVHRDKYYACGVSKSSYGRSCLASHDGCHLCRTDPAAVELSASVELTAPAALAEQPKQPASNSHRGCYKPKHTDHYWLPSASELTVSLEAALRHWGAGRLTDHHGPLIHFAKAAQHPELHYKRIS